jgi:hypothetical protein
MPEQKRPWEGTLLKSLHSVSMEKETPPHKRKDKAGAEPSPQRGMPGVSPIDADAFSRRAGEIIAKSVAPSGEKSGGSPQQRRKA